MTDRTSSAKTTQRPKLSDVARRAGVDVSTASRILSGDSNQRVSSETRERIQEAARELNYRPNPLARGLRTARTYTLGLVVPQLDNPVFSAAIRGAEIAAARAGYSLLICHRDPVDSGLGTYRRLAETHRVDGLLVASLDSQRGMLEELQRAGIPFVLMNRSVEGASYAVALDNMMAAGMAMDHLLDLGHTRIAHLAGHLEGYNGQARLAGYRQALERRGIAFDPSLVVPAGYTPEGGAAAMDRLLALPGELPSAVFAATLVSAAGAMRVLHREGIAIPERMSLIALHDATIAEMVYPPLTTVRTPTQKMGEIAAETLIRLVSGDKPASTQPLAPEGLVIRGSTSPRKK